jgi:SAM-dependent methyltransferase
VGDVFARGEACDLCGEHEVELIASQDRRSADLPTVLCRCCGLISHQTLPVDEQLYNYYALEYRQEYHGESRPSPRRVLRAWRNGQSIVRCLQPYLDQDDKVFEVGAGLGCTVKALAMAGYDATGIEPGIEFHAYSRDVLRTPVEYGRLEDLQPVPSFDFVLLVHVIEHLNHPARALRRVHSLLKPAGRLYVECPNIYGPHAAPRRLFHFAHVHNFTPWTLKMMAEHCGFRLIGRLSADSDRNLRFVLEKTDPRELVISPDSYHRSLEGVRRYNTLSYHLRRGYLIERCRSLWSLAGDAWFANLRLNGLIQRLSEFPEHEQHPVTALWQEKLAA